MKRRMVQRSIDKNAKEMNSKRSGAVMEALRGTIDVQGVVEVDARRIASSDSAQYVLFKRPAERDAVDVESESAMDESQDSADVEYGRKDGDSAEIFEDDWVSGDSADEGEIPAEFFAGKSTESQKPLPDDETFMKTNGESVLYVINCRHN